MAARLATCHQWRPAAVLNDLCRGLHWWQVNQSPLKFPDWLEERFQLRWIRPQHNPKSRKRHTWALQVYTRRRKCTIMYQWMTWYSLVQVDKSLLFVCFMLVWKPTCACLRASSPFIHMSAHGDSWKVHSLILNQLQVDLCSLSHMSLNILTHAELRRTFTVNCSLRCRFVLQFFGSLRILGLPVC